MAETAAGEDGSGASQGHEAVLQGRAQRRHGVAAGLGQLIKERDAVVGEADFPRARDTATADGTATEME